MYTRKFSSATVSVLLLVFLLSACQPIQPEPAALSQIQPTETVTAQNTVTDQNNDSSHGVPQAVRAMEGTYVGSWTVFGIDEEGQAVKLVSWTDTIRAENPQMDGEQAYVLTTGKMVFDNSNIPPMEIAGKEGYFLLPDGTLGDYFVETNGQLSKSNQLRENVWISVTPASSQELASYRLPNVSSGQHILNKVITREAGVEIHRITRVTTVNWGDQVGQDSSTQFVSLQGFHQRQNAAIVLQTDLRKERNDGH